VSAAARERLTASNRASLSSQLVAAALDRLQHVFPVNDAVDAGVLTFRAVRLDGRRGMVRSRT
jgi:hypothetical protein